MATNSLSLTTEHHVHAASTWTGARVHNFAGEDLGKVDDFVLDFDSGHIAYVVVSVGGFLGLGDKLYAVPWDLFSIRTEDHELFLDMEKQMLLDGPSFERSHWPDMGDESWADTIRTHYSQTQSPYWNGAIDDAVDSVGDDRF